MSKRDRETERERQRETERDRERDRERERESPPSGEGAVVLFQPVDPPVSELLRVETFVLIRAGLTAAGTKADLR